MRPLYPILLSLLLILAVGSSYAAGVAQRLPADAEPLLAETATGQTSFTIEIADEPHERQKGLMFRQSMPADRGMLFVFEEEARRGFWMQNTPLPLDLLFIATDGTVRAIENGVPFSTASISPDVNARFVLELVAGTAQKAGIKIGDRLRHRAIDAVK